MQSYVCDLCDYTYEPNQGDPERGISPGTSFDDLTDSWVCPVCGAEKHEFQPVAANFYLQVEARAPEARLKCAIYTYI